MADEFKSACRELLEAILAGDALSLEELSRAKKTISARHNLSKIPRNSDILAVAEDDEKELVRAVLQRKPVRTISGVAVVAVMTSPYKCPHGLCIPCPGGPHSSRPRAILVMSPRRCVRSNRILTPTAR